MFHVLNRGVGRRVLFAKDEDFLAFERVVEETLRTRRMRLCAHCLVPNHLYQGRYKCFSVETEDYFQVVRYVERNALRANLVERAESWRW